MDSASSSTLTPREFRIDAESSGSRLDRAVSKHCTDLSRTRVQELIEAGLVMLNGAPSKTAHKVKEGDVVSVVPQARPALRAEAESIPLEILYEDDDVIAVNKPAGMMVHAGAGNAQGTLVNALLGRGQSLSQGGDVLRPGIVHRIDKETSGIVLVAKNDFAHTKLAEAFRARTVEKIYIALVQGELGKERGRIELPIARDPKRRTRMTARRAEKLPDARAARTDWRVLARIDGASLLAVQIHTGRTHQIRAHFAALGHPVIGDTLYGAKQVQACGTPMPALHRNFLHAAKIGFAQPRTGQEIRVVAPLPAELLEFLQRMARACGEKTARIDAALAAYL